MVRTRYEAYGNTAAGAVPNGIGFTGHLNDPDTGLVYMQQRYYDPTAARFMSLDPVVTDANTGRSFGRYHYANNNPFKFVDPDGRDPDRSGSAFQEALATCQRDTGTDCGHRGSSSGRATAVKAGMAVGGIVATTFTGGCALSTAGTCLLVGTVIVGGGIATGAVVANTAFDLVDWMKGLIHSSAEADRPAANPNAPPPDNAYAPDGPKAPGRPTAADGFEPPKGGDQWVKNPNGRGYGWLGSDERVWVPTGPADPSKGISHGGPHWDVQTGGRRPSYENIKPVRP